MKWNLQREAERPFNSVGYWENDAMKIFVNTFATSLMFMIVSCKSLDSPLLNQLVKAGANDKTSTAQYPTPSDRASGPTRTDAREEGCYTLPEKRSAYDVDTLYARAMRNFNFMSPEQIAIYRKTVDKTFLIDRGYRHEKQSGSFYHLAQTVRYELPTGQTRAMWLELTFSKAGPASDISTEYCIDPKDPLSTDAAAHQKIRQRLVDLLVK